MAAAINLAERATRAQTAAEAENLRTTVQRIETTSDRRLNGLARELGILRDRFAAYQVATDRRIAVLQETQRHLLDFAVTIRERFGEPASAE